MRRSTRVLRLLLAGLLTSAGITAAVAPAHAAGEQVTAWLTTTDDAGGRHVVRGLQAQPAFAFQAGSGGSGENITVDENTGYQTFTGGGASFTDTAAWLMNGSGALSATTRDATLRKLFSPTEGIGLSFLRNPMGGSTSPAPATPTTTSRPARRTPICRSSRSHTTWRTWCR